MSELETAVSIPPAPYVSPHARPAIVRLVRAIAVGVVVGVALSPFLHGAVCAIAGWDAGGLSLLVSAWRFMAHARPDDTRCRAAAHDPGRTWLFALVIVASSFSMFANAVVLRHARSLPAEQQGLMVGLCLGAAAIAWFLTHTIFALRYAHLYYRGDEGPGGGLEFPGNHPPCDLDFAYFSFTIGMCFQVSDVVVSSRLVRRTALVHALLSFAFNTVVVALALNLVFALMQ